MKHALLLLALAALDTFSQAQDLVKQGEAVFSKSCATGYCHGARGTNGGAPRVAARGFDQGFIRNTVTNGVAGAAMPAFGTTLSRADLTAVIAYVASLNGVTNLVGNSGPPDTAPDTAKVRLSADAARGRDLFSNSVRGFARCSTCHEVAGIGIPVATPIAQVPTSAAALKALATPQVSTASAEGESMPALVVSKTANAVIFYDLTTSPPVLRTASPSAVQTRDGSSWRHASVIGAYNDAELAAILSYLRAVVRP
jgi:mono/diheme cytochrome c family protein